jgi:hypothetical protein
MDEGYDQLGSAKFAFNRMSIGCPGLIKLWRWDRERQCYTMIEWYRFKGKPLDQKAHSFFSRM